MKSEGFLCVIAVGLVLSIPAASHEGDSIRPTQRLSLFNGRDLENFYTWLEDFKTSDPAGVFSVVDQVDGNPAIRISGEHWGGLVTRESFRDYHLVVEFRWGLITWGDRAGATRDSGILVHARGADGNTSPDFNGPWMRSIEAQIIQGGVGDFILVAGYTSSGTRLVPALTARVFRDRDGEPVFHPEGELEKFEGGRINWFGRDPDWSDTLDFRGRDDVESPLGEWTRLEVVCDGDRITNIVNGIVVNEGIHADLTDGRILIQSEGAEIYFRRIDLLPIP